MAVNPNEDTEFNDALRRHGILPPREPEPRTPSPPPSPTLDELLDDLSTSELNDLGDDTGDETKQRIIEQHKRQRVHEERERLKRARFGRVYPIGRDDYTREADEEEKGTGVVCFLYKDGIPRSDRASQHVRILAQKYPRTKFVSIVGDKCIPNLPDSRIPMFIMYKKGDIRNQVIAWGADRERRVEGESRLLNRCEPESRRPRDGRSNDDEEEDDAEGPHAKSRQNVRDSTKKDDSDSDFEFDL
ncbi:thioredoxin-like protein [Amanita rubescens]|nr:thioredoxin-like protein [Amanita rubescens]